MVQLLSYSRVMFLGFWIGGFGLGENMEERPSLLNAVIVSDFPNASFYNMKLRYIA